MKFKKLKNNKGFTLAEVLAALLILLLMTAIVAAGIPVAARVYTKAVDAANAQVLLSTTVTELRYMLSKASEITVEGNVIKFSDDTYGKMQIANSSGIELTYANGTTRKIVSDEAATKNLTNSYETVSCSDGRVIFSNIKVISNSGNELADLETLVITPIK